MKGRQPQGSNDLALYISFLSTFYDRMTERHSRRNILRRQWLALKQEMQAVELDHEEVQKEKSTNGKVEPRLTTIERLRKTFSNYRVYQLNKENTFYVMLGMSFLCQLVSSKSREAVQRMQTQLKLSKPLTSDSSQHQYLLQKLQVLFDYLLKVMNQKDVQLQSRMQTFSSEDNGILGKAIKLILHTRNPKALPLAILNRSEPDDNEIQLIAQTLDISLIVLTSDGEGHLAENVVSKRGKFPVYIGFDEETDSYFQLEPHQPSVQQNEQQEQLDTMLDQLTANGHVLRKLGIVGGVDFARNQVIRAALHQSLPGK